MSGFFQLLTLGRISTPALCSHLCCLSTITFLIFPQIFFSLCSPFSLLLVLPTHGLHVWQTGFHCILCFSPPWVSSLHPWHLSHWRYRPLGFLPLVCLNLIRLLIQQVLPDMKCSVVAFNSMSYQISRALKSSALLTAAFFLTLSPSVLCRVIISLPPGSPGLCLALTQILMVPLLFWVVLQKQ